VTRALLDVALIVAALAMLAAGVNVALGLLS
jgi:hypothetical protein